jgi:hypothetical protein
MSRTNIFIILGMGLGLLLALIGGAALFLYSFFMIDNKTPVPATPIVLVEPLLLPTDALIVPTGEPTPETAVTPTPTAEAGPTAAGSTACSNAALFVSDLTIPDNSQVAPNGDFLKTWRIKNNGTCTWDGRYHLIHSSGPTLDAVLRQIALPATVAPGQTVDISVQMRAPVTPGTYQSNWLLESLQGTRFGVGRSGSAIWVKVQVPASQPQPTPTPTSSAACTHAATFVADLSIPDDSEIPAGASFIKTWRIRNSGTCTWDGHYKLAHVDGHLLGAVVGQIGLPASVAPGQTIDLSVQLTAPTVAGSYRGDWKLVTPQNNLFGVGSSHTPLWVKIKVVTVPTQDGSISGLVYQDQNENGRYDSGEQVMGNREVWLIAGTACHVLQNALLTTRSGADGRYRFEGRFSGNYCLGLMGGDGLLEDVTAVNVTGGQVVTQANLRALISNGSISGYLWDDYCLTGENGEPLAGSCLMDGNGGHHADGMIQPTENYIAGVTISLRPGPCTGNSGGTMGAVSNSNGRYTFADLNPGTYCVFMNAASPENAPLLLPGDWTFPARGIWYHQITLAAGEHLPVVNFGWDYQLR